MNDTLAVKVISPIGSVSILDGNGVASENNAAAVANPATTLRDE